MSVPSGAKRHVLPRVHGSAVFTSGQTQTLTTCTLGMLRDAQKLEGLDDETNKRYMHQYNFPGYCTGEAKALRSPGRREIGHGALAERALDSRASLRGGVPLRDPRRQRHSLFQRFVLDGVRLRLHDGADGCGRSHQSARRGRCHGPDQKSGDGRIPRHDRHSGA